MTDSPRRSIPRLIGQLGLITFGATTVAEFTVLVAAIAAGPDTQLLWDDSGPLLGARFSYWAAALTALAAAWSSLRARRRGASVALAAVTIGLLVASVVSFQSALPLLSMALVPLQLAQIAWVLVAAACLGRGCASPRADDDVQRFGRSPWLWRVMVPMQVLAVLCVLVGYLMPMTQALIAPLLAACGVLYEQMRRRRFPAAASWITPTLVLVALSALAYLPPVITQLRYGAMHGLTPAAGALALVLVLLCALATLCARQLAASPRPGTARRCSAAAPTRPLREVSEDVP